MPRKPKTAGDGTLAKRIGANIKSARTAAALTQGQLAETLGLENVTISRIETGVQMPSIERLDDIASVLKVSLTALLADKSASSAVGEMFAEVVKDLPVREKKFVYDFAASYANHWRTGKKK